MYVLLKKRKFIFIWYNRNTSFRKDYFFPLFDCYTSKKQPDVIYWSVTRSFLNNLLWSSDDSSSSSSSSFFFSLVCLSFLLRLIVDTIQRWNSESERSLHIHKIYSEHCLCFLLPIFSISFFNYNILLSILWMWNNVSYQMYSSGILFLLYSFYFKSRVYLFMMCIECISWKWMTILYIICI